MLDRFDYASYRSLLAWLLEQNRNLLFTEVEPEDDGRYFLLRHDVDYSPAAALRMAEIEQKVGCRATYFVLLSSPFYNLLSEQHRAFPRRLVELGHDVGLHYDLGVLGTGEPSTQVQLLELQADLLGMLSGAPVEAISMHNPSISGRDPFAGTDRYINVYEPRYTTAIRYLSDSCGAWRDAAIVALGGSEAPARLQLLVHPIFWGHDALDRWDRLDAFEADQIVDLQAAIAVARAGWLAHSGVLEHDQRNSIADLAASGALPSAAAGIDQTS